MNSPVIKDVGFFSGNISDVNKKVDQALQASQYSLKGDVNKLDLVDNSKETYRILTTTLVDSSQTPYFVIAIRGTHNPSNAISDAEAVFGTKSKLGDDMKAVSNWWNKYLTHMQAPIQEAVKTSGSDKILVAGHSLGGPFAAYTAYDLVKNNEGKEISLYTFNSPRPGNKKFADYLNANLKQNIRHSINIDVVSKLPPRTLYDWYHTGRSYITNITIADTKDKNVTVTSTTAFNCDDVNGRFIDNLKNVDVAHLFYFYGISNFDPKATYSTIKDSSFFQRPVQAQNL